MNSLYTNGLKRKEVERITGLSRSTIYRLMNQGKFPRTLTVSSMAVRWIESEIQEWLDQKVKERAMRERGNLNER